jgi:DNA-binding IclR family transcriptional regulator
MLDPAGSRVASVDRAFAILDCFHYGDRFLSLAEIAERTSLHKPTILRILTSLLELKYMARTENGLYFIGPAALRLASLHAAAAHDSDMIMAELSRLSRVTSETTSFSIRKDDFRIYIHRVHAPRRLRDNIHPGDASPVHKGATGRILLAFSESDDPRFERERIEMIATSNGEMEPGMTGISSPVFGEGGALAGAISVSGPGSRLRDQEIASAKLELLASAQSITAHMGGDAKLFDAAIRKVKAALATKERSATRDNQRRRQNRARRS